jgi:hypothetical protein
MEAPILPDPVVKVCKVVSFVLWLTFIPLSVSIVFSSVRRGRSGERGISHAKGAQIVCETWVSCRRATSPKGVDGAGGTTPHSSCYRGFPIGVTTQ